MWNDGGSDFTFQEIYKNKLLDELIGRRIDSFVLKGKPPGWTNESRADLINQTYLELHNKLASTGAKVLLKTITYLLG